MKVSLALSTIAFFVLSASTSSAAIVKLKATLDGKQEVPPVETTSNGTADLELDDQAHTLTGTIELTLADGTKVTNQNLQMGKCGDTGNLVGPLTEPGMNGVIAIDPPLNLDPSTVAALKAGTVYINIHTEKHTTGELRGQVYPADSTETCPASPGAGDGGTTPSNDTASTQGDGGGSSNGASSGKGCSTSGGSPASSGIAVALGLAAAAGAVRRRFSPRKARRSSSS